MATGPADPADLNVLSGLAPELATAFVTLASDVALVIDGEGVIRNVAVGEAGPVLSARNWVGRHWVETVTGDTRRKIELLLQEVDSAGVTRRREVNHPSSAGGDIPMSYAALRLGDGGPVIAVGRDLSMVATIQQRFIDAQQEMERDYWKLRLENARQRLLAQVASDAVMVVDALTLAVVQANAAARELFGDTARPLPPPIEELLVTARTTGRPAEVRTRLDPASARQVDLSATPFRTPATEGRPDASVACLLVRARPAGADGTASAGEAVVVTDSNGKVLMANGSFGSLCRGGIDAARAAGELLVDLLGDPQRHLAALLAEVRRSGLVAGRPTRLGGGPTPAFEAEVSASLMADGDQECIGLTLRRLHEGPSADTLPMALQGLVERVGQLSLAELVQQAADLTERHAIEAALRRAADNLRNAATLLGLDEAELAQRLQRLGLQAHG